VKQKLCYILLVALVFLNPFLSRHYTLLHYYLIIYRSLSRLHISARADHPRGAAYTRARAGARLFANGVKKSWWRSNHTINNSSLNTIFVVQIMIPNSQLIFFAFGKKRVEKKLIWEKYVMRILRGTKQELCYILLVALVFLNPFYRDTTRYYVHYYLIIYYHARACPSRARFSITKAQRAG
jgi:hypothetical protein